ncbi:WGxxGxxG family protein [Streptosporangium sp. NPDC000239]|uniref:WGxxGxxG family protein n=1 Tax=unclassified Streptosporangium TaxID=2632669 RepID=UPI0033183680
MRKTLTGLGLAFFLTLGPAATAATDSLAAPVTQSQPTPAPQNNNSNRDSGDKTGLWGLLGLVGLLGLSGLRKHREYTGTGAGAHVGDRPTRP